MSITPLTGTDTFKTWFDRTNTIISTVNGLGGGVGVSGATGISVTVSGNTAIISNTGIIGVCGGTGISISVSGGIASFQNIGVFAVNGQTGNVQITGLSADVVTSFNGQTGGVTGVVNILAGTGLSKGGSDTAPILTNTGVLTFNGSAGAVVGVASFNGSTGSVVGVASFNGLTGSVSGVTTSVANTFTALQTFNAGISASGATFGTLNISNAIITGEITVSNVVSSFNGLTGAVSGVTTSVANVFAPLQTFNAGISASGATFTGPISAPNVVATTTANTFTALQSFTSGLSAAGSVTFASDILANSVRIGIGGGNTYTNTVVGRNSLVTIGSGFGFNTAIGSNALTTATTTTAATAVGSRVLTNGGSNSTVVGANCLAGSGSSNNVAIGVNLLVSPGANVQENVVIGNSIFSTGTLVNVQGNVAIGNSVLTNNTSGTNNTAIGYRALSGYTGNNTVALGADSLRVNTSSGINNTAVGYRALDANTVGSNNIALGNDALGGNTGGVNNIAIGYESLLVNTASNNIGIGTNALVANTSGTGNISIGTSALRSNITGNRNIVVGLSAGSNISPGQENIIIGNNAARTCSSGASSVVIGNYASDNSSTVGRSVIIGYDAYKNINTALSTSVIIGISAGTLKEDETPLVQDSRSVFIGANTKGSVSGTTRQIIIGADAVGLGSNTTVLGTTHQVSAIIYGTINAPSGLSSFGATFTANINAPNVVYSVNGLTGDITVTGITWSTAITNRGLSANSGLFATPASGVLGLTLPASSPIGTIVRVSGVSGGWRLGQNSGQTIYFGNLSTTTGINGYLESTHARDSVELVCYVADTNWNVISSIGTIQVV